MKNLSYIFMSAFVIFSSSCGSKKVQSNHNQQDTVVIENIDSSDSNKTAQ